MASQKRKAGKAVPALKNAEVTGMTAEKQDRIIGESGRAPRARAAEQFLEEQEDQAEGTGPGERAWRESNPQPPA